MRKVISGLLTLSFVISAWSAVSAHPGRTAADGMHYCRTNCDDWGVPWNERHGHSGSSSYSGGGSSFDETYSAAAPKYVAPVVEKKLITALDQTPVYSQPKVDAKLKLFSVAYGSEVRNSGKIKGWITVKQADGKTVYISSNHVVEVTPYDGWNTSYRIEAEKGYIFPVPSAASQAKGSLSRGEVVSAIGTTGDWIYVTYSDAARKEQKGFVKKTIVSSY